MADAGDYLSGALNMRRLRKHFDLFLVALVTLALVFYDLTMELMTELVHLFFELLYELFEWFELGVEHVIEFLFETTHHGSQIVTFYILWLIAGFGLYRFWCTIPRLNVFFKEKLHLTWARRKTEMELYWMTLTLHYKLLMLAIAIGVAFLASFFVL